MAANVVRLALPGLDLRAGIRGWERFLSALRPHWDSDRFLVISLGQCHFICDEGAAVLAMFAAHRTSWGASTRIERHDGDPRVIQQLDRWHLDGVLAGIERIRDPNAIPLLVQKEIDEDEIIRYMDDAIRVSSGDSPLPRLFTKRTITSVIELFANVFEHSQSPSGGLTPMPVR